MKKLLIVVVLCLTACDSGVIVHDEMRGAELIVDFLSTLQSSDGVRTCYEWTDDSYKESTSFAEFAEMVSGIRRINQGAEIRVNGYEVFGPRNLIVVYASSAPGDGHLYLRFALIGTKTEDYYLLNLNIDSAEFEKEGIYRDYNEEITVKGV